MGQIMDVEYGAICLTSEYTAAALEASGVDSGIATSIVGECETLYPNETYFNDVAEDTDSSPTNTMAKYIQDAIGAVFEALADYGATAGLDFT